MQEPDTESAGASARERAATLLVTPDALVQLSLPDAREVVRYMQPRRVAAGRTFIKAGEAHNTHYMVLVINGEVTVEHTAAPGTEGLVVSVLGPGSLIGEMGLIDGSPRSASCIAATDLDVGVLTRDALTRLIDRQPAVAARFLLAISKRIADRLRESNRKLLSLSRISQAQLKELDAAHSINKRLLDMPR